MSQGGVIGKTNEPTNQRASGLWRLEELFRARLGGNWPVAVGLIDFIYRRAKNDVDGNVFAYNAEDLIDPTFADRTAGLLAEVEVFHYSLATFPAGLTVTSSLSLGEDADKPERMTALVVDGPLTLEANIGVTNGRSRLAFVVLSRDDIDVGNGRNIVQPRFTYVEEPDATEDYRPYTFSKFAPEPTNFLQAGGDGGKGGASGSSNPGGRGGSGGVAFGGSPAPLPWPQSATGTAGADGQPGPGSANRGGGGGGGSPAGSGGTPGGSGGSLPAGGTLIVAGNAVTIPPSGTITAAGGAGGAGGSTPPAPFVRRGGGGGGAGGHPITIFHAGAFVNNGTITAAGGSGGPGPGPPVAQPGDPGGAGEITVAPVPTGILNQ